MVAYDILQRLHELRNYSGVVQILSGLNDISIQRLKGLKDVLPTKYAERFMRLDATFSTEGNYKQYRQLPFDPPFLPFMGTPAFVVLIRMLFLCVSLASSFFGSLFMHFIVPKFPVIEQHPIFFVQEQRRIDGVCIFIAYTY